MTIAEAIEKIDSLKPNSYTQAEKISWLNIVEGLIYRNIILTHADGEEIEFKGYNDKTPDSTELIAYEPYDELYVVWLESKIDYYNAEIQKYNNSITHFNDIFTDFGNDYNRNHMPKGKKFKFF